MKASEVREAIGRLDSLSTLPVVMSRVMKATNDPSSSPEELYKIIARDQALAEKTVRVANAPFFGYSNRISNISQAIMLLGYENIRHIAASVGVMSMLSGRCDRNIRRFWAHSYEVAVIAANVAEIATVVCPPTAFLSGLLHDTGRLLFYSLSKESYSTIAGLDDILEKETELFGCDHALAGSWLAEKANLPQDHVLAIRHHHAPAKAREFSDHVAVVALAEALSRRYSPKIEDDGIWSVEYDAILLELSLTNDALDAIRENLKEADEEIEGFLDLL